MLTLITGAPGAGKSLYTVWERARFVPGSYVEKDQQQVPRRLLSNIKDLLLEHDHIGPDDLSSWHEWAKPGDVIVYDEVQEVWRPRGLGSKVPDCIAALETHRHKGVDIVLITQHPMLVDPNIRRLVNQHLHLRRITRTVAMVYEWDHCANPGQTKTAIQSKVWFHPKKAYDLYKSAQLHTKPTAKLPRVALLGLAAVAFLFVLGPFAYGRITGAFDGSAHGSSVARSAVSAYPLAAASPPAPVKADPDPVAGVGATGLPAEPGRAFSGCVAAAGSCRCYDASGTRVEEDEELCTALNSASKPLSHYELPDVAPARVPDPGDLEALSFLAKQRGPRS